MTLRKKTLSIIGLTLVGVIAVSYLVFSTIIVRGFAQLEEGSVRQNVTRILESVADSLSTLKSKTGDWANWDEAYDFMENEDPEFIRKSLTNTSFSELQVNIIAFVNPSGRVVFCKAFDLDEEQEAPIPEGLYEHLSTGNILLHHNDTESSITGIILLPEGPMLLASRPILTSEGKGPIHGALIIGRYLDSTEVRRLAEKTRLDISVHQLDDLQQMRESFKALEDLLSEQKAITIQSLSDDTIAGYTMLKDIYGKPSLLLQVEIARSISKYGKVTMRYLILSFLGIALVFGSVTIYLLERWVLSPLVRLSKDVEAVGNSGNVAARVSVRGRDELASLAATVNGMLEALECSQHGLQKAKAELEVRVRERTEALGKANESLHVEIKERRRAEEALQRAHDDLEQRVEVRTAELLAAYEQLKREMRDREKAEVALRDKDFQYREFTDSLPQSVFEMDAYGKLVFANSAACELFGYSREDIEAGLNGMEILAPEDRERGQRNIERILHSEKVINNEYIALKKDGSEFPIAIYSSRIVNANKPVGVRGFIIDLTEQKRIEKELLRAQKLESLSILAGGIAHDFNNLLTGIIGNISLAKMYKQSCGEVVARLEETEKAALTAKALTQQLLTFSRGGSPIKKTVSIADLIKDSAGFVLRGSNVRCEFSIPDDLWPVDVDEGQISQVINNLIINADQAMPQGGIIRVCAENAIVESSDELPLSPGKYIKMAFIDQGTGIQAEHLTRIFDPYFTTKQKGSGLGLATTYSIVIKHNGHITVESDLGRGTTFHVYLPASENTIPIQGDIDIRSVSGYGKVLVMDDEPIIRNIAGAMLHSMGYEVEFAKDGAEAIELYQNARMAGHGFDTVIMDLTIPGGMGGKETIQKLLNVDPDVKAIVSSGYSDDPIMSCFYDYGFKGVVAKPYRMEELSEALHNVIHCS